jgi:hypothetical protein
LKVIAMPLSSHGWIDQSPMSEPPPIIRHHFTGPDEPTQGACRSPRQLLTFWGSRVFTGIVIAAGLVVLTGVASQVTRHDQQLELANGPGSGIVVRSDVLGLWLPYSMFELVNGATPVAEISTHQGLQHVLVQQNQKNLWYALTIRGHQVNGEFIDLTIIRKPYDDPNGTPEMVQILNTVAGNPPRTPAMDFSTASVHIIPDDLLNREPREVVAALLGHPSESIAEPPCFEP